MIVTKYIFEIQIEFPLSEVTTDTYTLNNHCLYRQPSTELLALIQELIKKS